MLIKVPYVYCATIVPPRCRKACDVFVQAHETVQINDLSSAELAASWMVNSLDGQSAPEYHVYHCHGHFWEELAFSPGSDAPESPVSVTEWLERVSDPNAYGNPFKQTHLARAREAARRFSDLPVAGELTYREYLSDTKTDQERALHHTAWRYGVLDGRIFVKRDEPIYRIQTFGIGNNHGGTSLFVEGENVVSPSCRAWCFNLNNLSKAAKAATTIAESRRDTQSLPMTPDADVTIHKPAAFTFDPYCRKALDAGDISLIEYLSNSCRPTSKLDEVMGTAMEELNRQLKAAGPEAQLKWLESQNMDPEELMTCFVEG